LQWKIETMLPFERPKPTLYRSFVLHIWREGRVASGEQPIWRMSLEDPHSAERIGFKGIDELVAFLKRWAASDAAPDIPPGASQT
jgi:hypothetical protein